jgi:RDD family.
MVIRDFPPEDLKPKGEQHPRLEDSEIQMAQPTDRMAAVMIDLVAIVGPLALLFMAPFRRMLTESVLLDDDLTLALSIAAMILIGIGTVIIYQTVMIATLGATVGKLFFGLRVQRIWDQQQPGWESSFIRAVFWVCEVLPFGLPF